MNTNRSWRRTEGTQIDLSDLLCRLCRQWKQMVVCALVFAVLAGGYSYLAGTGSGIETLDSEVEAEIDASAADVEKEVKLKEEQEQGVTNAIYLAQEIKGLEEYLEHSVLMQIDPNHKSRVVLLYSIENTANRSMQKIAENYLSFLTNGGVVEAVRKADREWKSMSSSYLAELLMASQKNNAYQIVMDESAGSVSLGILLYVEVIGKDAEMAGKLARSVQSVLKDYSRDVKNTCGSHELYFISSEASEKIDTALLAQQREKRAQLTANRTNLKTLLNEFDEEQKRMYQMAFTQTESPELVNGMQNTEMQSKNENTQNTEIQSSASTEEQSMDAEQRRSISALYVLLGVLGGIFTYSGIYTIWYVMYDTIKSVREFKLYYTIPFYGCIYFKKIACKSNEDAEIEKTKLLNRIRFACKKHNVSKIFLTTEFTVGEEEKNCLQKLTEQLCMWEIDAVVVENADRDSSAWDELSETGAVLILCKMDTTTYRRVDDAMEFYLENDMKVFGAAVLE